MSRKYRYVMEGDFPVGKIPSMFIKLNTRPEHKPEIKEQAGEHYKLFPQQEKWNPVITTIYDGSAEALAPMWTVFAAFFDQNLPNMTADERVAHAMKNVGDLKIQLLVPDYEPMPIPVPSPPTPATQPAGRGMGIGTLGGSWPKQIGWKMMEEWILKGASPSQVSFGELDYSSSDTCEVVITWHYTDVLYKFNTL